MSFNIILPKQDGTAGKETLTTSNNIVLIGSNGAGKTRLGTWIEQQIQNQVTVHRISAQKALNIPDYAQLKNLEQAEKELLHGSSSQHSGIQYKNRDRWGRKPSTHLLNDYDKLLSLLFAKSADRDKNHSIETKQKGIYIPVPDAPIDIIIKIWNEIMPHREISFSNGKVVVHKQGSPEYHGQEMSDGERVTLYLIGQCLCVPENSVIIIDEPEIHLHKSLVDKLWNKVEELCQNKLLIFITHDLDFASSRTDAYKIWVKTYVSTNQWKWEYVPEDENLPDSLIIEIIGNRKNLIFCEGESGSLDTTVYQLVYPNHHIIPRGSCDKVIETTKAIKNNPKIHHLNAYGIIDSDYREDEEIANLESHDIFTISVAEIENLFCIEPIIRIISEHLELNPDDKVQEVTTFLIEALTSEFDVQVSSKAEKIIEYKLGAYSKTENTKEGLKNGLTETIARINVDEIYNESNQLFQASIDSQNLSNLLLVYNRKSLPNRISGIFGLANGQYGKLLIRLMKGSRQIEILEALKAYMPQL